MNKQKSGIFARLKPLLAVPVILLMAMAFSVTGGLEAFGQDAPLPPPPPKNADAKGVSSAPADPADAREISKVAGIGQEEVVFKEVSQMPEFKGGQAAFITYIVENVKYPDEAKKKGIEGKVYIEFIVNKKGKITTAWVKTPGDPMLDAEALRVIANMPDWNPGKDEKGNPVNVSMVIPIQFNLDEKAKEKK